jgi:GT2 family glycosyltransferase
LCARVGVLLLPHMPIDISDYAGKKFVFCLPGSYYSGKFLSNLVGLTTYLVASDIQVMMAQVSSSCIHRLRNTCGGGNPANGLLQVPFATDGVDYDYVMWIDSDVVFTRDDFLRLLEVDKPVVTGWYYQNDGNPACGFTDKKLQRYGKRKKPNHPIYDPDHIYTLRYDSDITEKTEPYPIDWVGMGWMLIQRGVMESIQYPWFAPRTVRVSEDLIDSLSEDISFQINLREAGYDIWMHPGIRVGHEKTRVI